MFEQIKGKLFSPDSTGAFLDVSRSQVHRLISAKELEALKLGARTTRITGESIIAYLKRKSGVERKPVCIKKDDATKPSPAKKKAEVGCKTKTKAASAAAM